MTDYCQIWKLLQLTFNFSITIQSNLLESININKYRDEDLTSDMFKRNAADTVERILLKCSFGEKSELMKFIEYAAVSLQSNSVSDRHK